VPHPQQRRNMQKSKFAVSLVALAVAASTVAVAAPSQAYSYPAGQALTVLSTSSNIVTPGANATVSVENVYPGCSVVVKFNGSGSGHTLVANDSGMTSSYGLKTPTKAGVYVLSAATTAGCSEQESDSKTIYVGKKTVTTASLTSSSTKPGANTTLTVAGRVKFGSRAVAGAKVTIKVTGPKGSTTVTATTGSNGMFSVSLMGKAKTKGGYTAHVSYSGTTSYVKSDAYSSRGIGVSGGMGGN
jgi:hypothetical protein